MITPLFAEPIYRVENVISEEENQKIIDECYRLQANISNGAVGWDCDIYTAFGGVDLLHEYAFENLMHLTKKYVDEFKEETLHGATVNYANSWFNIAGPGQYQEQHLHPQNWFSATYYVKSPTGSSGTRFKAPYDNHMGDAYSPDSPYSKTYTMKPTERSLVIFPSHLPHWVPIGTNKEDRITIASNWN